MSALPDDLKAALPGWLGETTRMAGAISLLLYATGYLIVRFHLTTLGLGVDLSVIDERYLFAGARFVIYLLTVIPSLLLMALFLAPLLLVVAVVMRQVLRSLGQRPQAWLAELGSNPWWLTIVGLVVGVLSIQLVMKNCLALTYILLKDPAPQTCRWLGWLLEGPEHMALFFMGLLLLTGLTALSVIRLYALGGPSAALVAARRVLLLILGIQLMLLPVNFGVLVVDKKLPRIEPPPELQLPSGAWAWLAWEGREGLTVLVETSTGPQRELVTLKRERLAAPIRIRSYDSAFFRTCQTPLPLQQR
jgi:hypothetical protein